MDFHEIWYWLHLVLKNYSPFWTLASDIVFLYSFWSLATACQFLISVGLQLLFNLVSPKSQVNFPKLKHHYTFHIQLHIFFFSLDLCPSHSPKASVQLGFRLYCFPRNLFLWDWDVSPVPILQLAGQGVSFCMDPTFDLPGLWDSTIGYTAVSLLCEIIRSCKPHHHSKAEILTGDLILARCTEILSYSNFCECWRNIMDTLCSELCFYACILSTVN